MEQSKIIDTLETYQLPSQAFHRRVPHARLRLHLPYLGGKGQERGLLGTYLLLICRHLPNLNFLDNVISRAHAYVL